VDVSFAAKEKRPSKAEVAPEPPNRYNTHMPVGYFREDSPFIQEFRTFAKEEAKGTRPRGEILFYGSSSIRLWGTLREDFAPLEVINRGFGGSTLDDCLREMYWLVYPLEPKAMVFYAGDNDLDQGASPERLRALFVDFIRQVEGRLGKIPLLCLSIKASPARFWNVLNIRRANDLLAEAAAAFPQVQWLDICPLMLNEDGSPRRDLYTDDLLHVNRAGYELWAGHVRLWMKEIGVMK
jgi:lysophospholipase L1-like esterase